ncbi:MAG: ABC transporter permease [Treponema sp.]|nr:ABC transporter permease [Treponema sp.]
MALGIACIIAVPLGALCARKKIFRDVITGVFSTFRIIPSLGVLFLCIPVMGIGVKPALTALCFLAIPPILINTTTAFSSIAAPVLETARGMGMNSRRIFFTVKTPLALPLILTGFKTAAAEVIASATLVAYIGGGGLGTIIFTGLQVMRNDLLIIGGASVALLSISADYLLSGLERAVIKSIFGVLR